MSKKRIIILVSILVVLLLTSGIVYFVLTKEDKDTSLNLLEKQWIETNKNKLIDLSIANDVPVLADNGQGIFFDFLNSLETATALSFNKVSSKTGADTTAEYALKLVDQVDSNGILIYRDHYVLVTKNGEKYHQLEDIPTMVVGVLTSEMEQIVSYLPNTNLTFKNFENATDLWAAMGATPSTGGEGTPTSVDAVVVLSTTNLQSILPENKYHISYHLDEYTKDYVLKLGATGKLNDILAKYYKKWAKDNYTASYNKHFMNEYFTLKQVNESDKVKFRSKRYTYGFIENGPYDTVYDGKLLGLNSSFLANFAKLANVEINYKKYDHYESLINDFNANKVDFFFDETGVTDYQMDTYATVSPYSSLSVIVSHVANDLTVNSIASLKGKEVYALENSKIAGYLFSKGINVKNVSNMNLLLEKANEKNILALDATQYEYYVRKELKNQKMDYEFSIGQVYPYRVRDIKDNEIFCELYNFYLTYMPGHTIINAGYAELLQVSPAPMILKRVLIGVSGVIIVLIGVFAWLKLSPKRQKKKVTTLSKGEKLKYVDMLTSLKNRNYLNEHIEAWDNSEVYPQTIIIIDLNNVAYINDNYGHAEGDKVIQKAANILIQNQIENSEIIRTNGNEFLIYLTLHDEKQVVSYMRKLAKEFKDLDHGFGAAIGYSMIHDAIKTIDDAVNEATLDMRNNKEESTHTEAK